MNELDRQANHLAWLKTYYGQLKGCKIVDVKIKAEEDDFYGGIEFWPTLVIEDADGKRFNVEVSQDEEGNGAGFLFGLRLPAPTT